MKGKSRLGSRQEGASPCLRWHGLPGGKIPPDTHNPLPRQQNF